MLSIEIVQYAIAAHQTCSDVRRIFVYLSVQLDFSVLFLIIRNELQHELNNLRIG